MTFAFGLHEKEKEDTVKREFYSIPEFAKTLGVSNQHIFNVIKRGEIKKVKVGGRSLIPISELQRLLDSAK
jgi:excisionase family DNA binding protein